MRYKLGKIILPLLLICLTYLFGFSQSVEASCEILDGPHGPTDDFPRDVCISYSDGTAWGIAIYGCGYYPDLIPAGDHYGCYWHSYTCTTSCAAAVIPGACFVPGTIVGNSSGGKKIEDVKVGDKVESFADDKVTESVVSKIYKVTRDFYFKLVAGDYEVKVTAEHPFYIGNDKFEQVQNLKAGDSVYVMENKSLVKKTISSNTRINEKTDAYNLSVNNTQTYFADGFAVHNKTNYVAPVCQTGTTLSCSTHPPVFYKIKVAHQ
jgi:hypothetical protein